MIMPGTRFFQSSNKLFHYGLKSTTLAVYFYLISCAGSKESCWPSMKAIAAACGCGVTMAWKSMDELEQQGFIRRVTTYSTQRNGQNRQTNNTYYLLDLPPHAEVYAKPTFIEMENTERSRV